MHRLAALLLYTLVAAAVVAAPAPAPKPERPWVTGWDKPVDPLGDCHFGRDGKKLTITLPGGNHDLDVERGRLNAPRLMREVDGDFLFQVRVGGAFRPADHGGVYRAGILLSTGKRFIRVEKVAKRWRETTESYICFSQEQEPGENTRTWGAALKQPASLRLARRGDTWEVSFRQGSEPGREWQLIERAVPAKVKVGVFAESMSASRFKPEFDQFQLTPRADRKPPGDSTR